MYGIGTIINIKWLAIDTHEKLQERIQSRLPVQVPSLNAPECSKWILTSRGLWITVHRCAKRKRTSIMCVSNLPSLPWNVTGKVHKIRTTLKRRSNLPACFRKRMSRRCGKIPASWKSSSGGSGSSSNPVSIHPRTKSIHIEERDHQRGQNLDYKILRFQTCRKHSCETLIFKYIWFDTMMNMKEKKREQRIGMS